MKKLCALFFIIPIFVFCQIQTDTLDLSEYKKKFILSDRIEETSGIEFYNNLLYTFNDSGGKPEIYVLNPENGTIIKTIKINNAVNKDWEEIARKGDTLFIGDFGNNLGKRKDLTIYSIRIPEYSTAKEVDVNSFPPLYFYFEDQTDFENNEYLKTNFDCEAFIYYKGKLHVFSKRWGDSYTAHYELELNYTNSVQIAKKIESFNTECVITGADIYNDELYLIGYSKEGIAYIWKFTDFYDDKFFNGKAKKTIIGLTAAISQTEGIAITKDNIYITGEKMKYSLFNTPPILYIIDKSEL